MIGEAYSQELTIIGGDTYNWGNVPPTILSATIKIKNTGKKTLYISEVKPSCGCTSAPISKRNLSPGEVTDMKVNLNLDISYNGNISKKIDILSNDEKNPKKTLFLKCNVVKPLTILPSIHVAFRDLTVGLESTTKFTIKNDSQEDVVLSDFETSPSSLTINLSKAVKLKPGQKVELIAKITPTDDTPISTYIKFRTSNKDMPLVMMDGFARAKASNYFNPIGGGR